MRAIEIARRMAELGETKEAWKAYALALQDSGCLPEEELEAALYLLHSGGDYKAAYTVLRGLYDRGLFREECLSIMTEAFYTPNVSDLRGRYEKNCKELKRYPYLFRKDFMPFEDLPIRFYPYDDKGYLPFHVREGRFEGYRDYKYPKITRNFFHDLENPVLAEDVYSQYELEYLNDNVRKSEYVARENHIYLHYTDWGTFCAHLQVLNLRPMLKEEKLVFLIGNEIEMYPIDFKERYGLDYSRFTLKPVGIREVKRLIWHAQLSYHNGGDFFNEILDSHPNLLAVPSIMMEKVEAKMDEFREIAANADKLSAVRAAGVSEEMAGLVLELRTMRGRTDKDLLVTSFLSDDRITKSLDPAARIVPALFLQPHFGSMSYHLTVDKQDRTVLSSKQYEAIQNSPIFQNFKYIKTFAPIRRVTTSYGASVRFMQNNVLRYQEERLTEEEEDPDKKIPVVDNALIDRVVNRSYLVDPEDRLNMDSILVRFEDAKLNPKATFNALAAFLDLPVTESMSYCSLYGKRNPVSMEGNDLGFSTAAVYRTYDEYANDTERAFIEYFMRDVYEAYGYDFHYYDGQPVDEERLEQWIAGFTTLEGYIRNAWKDNILSHAKAHIEGKEVSGEILEQARAEALKQYIQMLHNNWHVAAKTLMRGLRFVNKNGQPLRMMPLLKLDPALLEQPLYH